MIQQVLNKQLLYDLLSEMQAQAQGGLADGRRVVTRTPMDDMGPSQRSDLLDSIETAKQYFAAEHTTSNRRGDAAERSLADRNTYLPRSPELSNLQSAIEYYFIHQRSELVESPQPDDRRGGSTPIADSQLTIWRDYLAGRRLFGAFEQTDVGWINSLFAEGIRRFRGKHEFVDRPTRKDPIPLANEGVRMIVIGDWGSGIPRAQNVAKRVRHMLDDPKVQGWQRYVVHLGDVYYSGWTYEYQNRFLNYWPVRVEEKHKIGSFNLNGNHDMYSGGWAYYDCALADDRFATWQGKSSLFHLANKYWQIFGLDTSHDEASLKGNQVDWLISNARKGVKTIILSHHQYCSSYEEPSPILIKKIRPVIDQLNVVAWLWGHEHRCMTYKGVPRIRFPRCVGHGGVPVYQTHCRDDQIPLPGEWEYRDYIDDGLEHWAKFGFVMLDFHHDKISMCYVNEYGTQDRLESIF